MPQLPNAPTPLLDTPADLAQSHGDMDRLERFAASLQRPSLHRLAPELRAASPMPPRQMGRRGALMAMGAATAFASSCAWVLHPERRGQAHGGRVDVVPLVVDILWFLPGLLPGAIFLIVDFGSGAIYTGGGAKAEGSAMARREAPKLLEASAGSRMLVRAHGDLDSHPLAVRTSDARHGERVMPVRSQLGDADPRRAKLALDTPAFGEHMQLTLSAGDRASHTLHVVAKA